MTESNKLYFGGRNEISYNTKTNRVCGADACFLSMTLVLILVPSLLAFTVIFLHSHMYLGVKIFMTVILSATLFLCLYQLYKVSSTDPGIIPSSPNS